MPIENHSNSTPVIAIDGHAGAGKSTVADLVAHTLGFWHVNTGLYYRAVTWLAFEHQLNLDDQAGIEALAHQAQIEVREGATQQEVFVSERAITDLVRTPEINRAISPVSAFAGVRSAITSRLQSLTHARGIIMDGRDIGTVVYPHAALKIFLTASVDERARRQHAEALAKGQQISFDDLRQMIISRDDQDSQRSVAPLKQADDAICIDSTGKTPQEIATEILTLWERKIQA